MKIKTKANKVGIESLGALSKRVIDTVNESEIIEAATTKQFLELVTVNSRYQDALEPVNQKEVSDAIDAVFEQRNILFGTMYDYVKGLLKSPDAEMQVAAKQIFDHLNKYGKNFSRYKIADQTLHYDHIVDSLKEAEHQPALAKMLLVNKVAQLDQLHLDYESLYRKRGNTAVHYVAPTKIRLEMEKAVKLYLDEVRWMASQNDSEPWKTLSLNVEKRFIEMNPTVIRKEKTFEAKVDLTLPKTSETL
ncbi:MAG: DUF6261 family protein [Paludibacter sp.]